MTNSPQTGVVPTLCRDCFADFDEPETSITCKNCGSPRLVRHPELRDLKMAHIDCDAFYATVEKRDDPSLSGKPVMIGGGQRGVVSTCCYIARMSGVRSAMPMRAAKRLCPNAVIIKPNMKKYVEVSKSIRTMMQSLTPAVEPLSIDEAFLDMTGTEKLHHAFPAKSLVRLAKQIEDDIGVSVSIGLSHNKFLAKVASDLDKPRGIALIGAAETVEFLAKKPISIIYGVGKVFTDRLRKDGLVTIGQLQQMEPEVLMRKYGETGARLARLAMGQDARKLSTSRAAKSVSAETTFNSDLATEAELSPLLLALCERVADRMKKQKVAGETVTLKLKSSGFATRTRARHLAVPSQLAHVIYENAEELMRKELDGTKFRLIGVGMSQIGPSTGEDPLDLLEPKIAKKAAAERAMDSVRDKFGKDAVVRGKLYRQKSADRDQKK